MEHAADITERTLPFPVVSSQVVIADRIYQLRRPESADALLALVSEEEFSRDERIPYWADIWPSSQVLAERLAAIEGHGRRLLELGCGVGLLAMAAASAGFSVVASDYYADALEFVTSNARLNGLDGIATRLVDWRDFPADLGQFDVVMAADVLYERPNAALVAAAIARSLAPGGLALVSDPGRRPAAEFPEICNRHDLDVVNIDQVPFMNGDTPLTIRVYEIRASSCSG